MPGFDEFMELCEKRGFVSTEEEDHASRGIAEFGGVACTLPAFFEGFHFFGSERGIFDFLNLVAEEFDFEFGGFLGAGKFLVVADGFLPFLPYVFVSGEGVRVFSIGVKECEAGRESAIARVREYRVDIITLKK